MRGLRLDLDGGLVRGRREMVVRSSIAVAARATCGFVHDCRS